MAKKISVPFNRTLSGLLAGLFLLSGLLTIYHPSHAAAATLNAAPQAKISFTFDDGYTSAVSTAAPTLAKYGLSGTDYVISGCVGMSTAPNTCHANTDATYMTWPQVTSLQNTYGWEIGSHTVTHPYLASSDASDGQPNVLTPAQVSNELTQSKATLAAHGFNATDFATPYGDYNNAVLAQIAKSYATHRGFADENNNDWPYNDYLLYDYRVQEGVTVAQVEAKINLAIANKQWLILTMHNIKASPSTDPNDYEYSTKELGQIAAYVKAKQSAGLISSVHVNQGPVTGTNLLANGSFNDGIATGWTTDSPTTITKDSGNNGSYPDPTNSVKLVSAATNKHLFSPQVAVNPNNSYMLKSFLNVQSISNGEVGFYVDEYDANGNWISGQYKKGEHSSFVENMNFMYKPSSANVAKASLQVIVTANSGITAYLDNVQWLSLNDNAPPPPVPTNMVANGTFDSGIAAGWHTDDPTTFSADSGNNGSPANPVNSVKLAASAASANSHLFSPLVPVSAGHSYSLASYLNIKQLSSGEIAFYVDEYDVNGNWISGQYKVGRSDLGARDTSFAYAPSSASVAKASLQVILVNNHSNILAYLDDVRWYQTQ